MSRDLTLPDIKNININQPNKLTAKDILFKYIIFLPLFIAVLAISLACAYYYIKYSSPVYNSSILVSFPNGNKGGGSNSGSDIAGLNDLMVFNKKVNLANEIQVLKTKTLMARAVNKMHLNLQIFKEGEIKKSEVYNSPYVKAQVLAVKDSSIGESVEIVKRQGNLFLIKEKNEIKINPETNISGENVTFHISIAPYTLRDKEKYIFSWQPVLSVAEQLSNSLSIFQPQREADILQLSISTEVPEKGKELLNAFAQEYNLSNNEQKNRLVDYTLNFIDQRIDLMRGELGKVEGGLQSYRQTNEIVDQQAQSNQGLGELSDTKNKIDNSEVKLQVITMVKQSLANPNQPITTLGIDDPTLLSLANQYNQFQFQKEEQLKTMPAANPTVKLTESQIEKLRSSILSSLDNIVTSTSKVKERYVGDFQTSRAKLNLVPGQQRQLLEIGRQQDIKEKLFMFLLQKKEEAAITKASGLSSNATALDPATASYVSPNTSNIYRIAIILGLLIPVLLIYLKELLSDKIINRQDIIGKTNTPVIGEISHNPEKKRRLVVSFDDRTIVGEQFRMIRTNIPFLMKGQDRKIMLVTSTTPGEGKTFCSLNLAAVFAIAGKKTVIVEMDLRKPKIAQSLKIEGAAGVTEYISGQKTLQGLPVEIPGYQNLFVITAGIIPPNPSEILMDDKIDGLFAYLKANFDCVIVDSAPVGLVSDAKILAKHADATIYIVRQRITAKKQIRQINELYENQVFPNLSLLVNDVKVSGANSYYGYGSNYMSTYKYSYGNEKELSIWQKAKGVIGL